MASQASLVDWMAFWTMVGQASVCAATNETDRTSNAKRVNPRGFITEILLIAIFR
jgi:hypothetical protein